jgi:hypothetical protein
MTTLSDRLRAAVNGAFLMTTPAADVCSDGDRQIKELEAQLDAVGEASRTLAEEKRALELTLSIVKTGVEGVWRWQGDGGDQPQSPSCPAVMSAERLRELLARAEKAEGERDRHRESLATATETLRQTDAERDALRTELAAAKAEIARLSAPPPGDRKGQAVEMAVAFGDLCQGQGMGHMASLAQEQWLRTRDAAARIFAPPVCEVSDEEVAIKLDRAYHRESYRLGARSDLRDWAKCSEAYKAVRLAQAREAKRLLLGKSALPTVDEALALLKSRGWTVGVRVTTEEVHGLTAEKAVGVALSIPMSTTTMDECQRLAPGVVEHLRRMGFEVRAVAATPDGAKPTERRSPPESIYRMPEVIADPSMPPNTVEIRSPGKAPIRITNIGTSVERYPTPALNAWKPTEGEGPWDDLDKAVQFDIDYAVKSAQKERDEWRERAAEMASRTVVAEREVAQLKAQIAAKPVMPPIPRGPSEEQLRSLWDAIRAARPGSTSADWQIERAIFAHFADSYSAAPALPTESELADAIWKGEKNWNEDKNAPLGAPSLRACIARAVLDLIVSKGVLAERPDPSPAQRPFVPSMETVKACALLWGVGPDFSPGTVSVWDKEPWRHLVLAMLGLAKDVAAQAAGKGGK